MYFSGISYSKESSSTEIILQLFSARMVYYAVGHKKTNIEGLEPNNKINLIDTGDILKNSFIWIFVKNTFWTKNPKISHCGLQAVASAKLFSQISSCKKGKND